MNDYTVNKEDLYVVDKIAPAFEKEVNDVIQEELKQILKKEPNSRDKEIEKILRQEKEKYEIKKKEFYENSLHWSNNKRKMHGLNVLRGEVNKCRNKKFYSFKPTPRVFFLVQDMIEGILCDNLKDNNFFNIFVDIKNIDVGDKNLFDI